MNWVDEELERRRKEEAARAASLSEESSHRDIVSKGLPWAWKHLLDAVVSDIEKFNSLSDRKAEARVSASEVDVHWLGKAAPLLTIRPQPGLRQAVVETVSRIASQCDGVRCDMAMLVLNAVFERTWGSRAGERPATEYWGDVIPAVRRARPDFLFVAEAYWDMEWELQKNGFDFCYDKRLYDRLEHDNAESIRLHLCADLAYQEKLLRFLENHDEPRAAATFSPAKERVAAVTISTLPGARLFHEGQFEGRKVRLPVFLGRRPEEPADEGLQVFYAKLLAAIDKPAFRDGQWSLCERTGWPDNTSFQNLVAWNWVTDDDRHLIVVNLSDSAVQALVHVPWGDVHGETLHLIDALSGATYDRNGDEMLASGLYVELGPWNCHFLQCHRTSSG